MDTRYAVGIVSKGGTALGHIALGGDGSVTARAGTVPGQGVIMLPEQLFLRVPPPPPPLPKPVGGGYASYTKLKSGAWGIRVNGRAREGGEYTVKKKDGSTKTEVVEKVLWTDGSVSLCAIRQTGSGSGGSGGTCDECGRPAARLIPCRDSSGISGRCCPRCASMSPYERSFA